MVLLISDVVKDTLRNIQLTTMLSIQDLLIVLHLPPSDSTDNGPTDMHLLALHISIGGDRTAAAADTTRNDNKFFEMVRLAPHLHRIKDLLGILHI